MNIISLCNYVVEPMCPYTKYIYNPLVLTNVVLVLMLHFCAEHCEHAHIHKSIQLIFIAIDESMCCFHKLL